MSQAKSLQLGYNQLYHVNPQVDWKNGQLTFNSRCLNKPDLPLKGHNEGLSNTNSWVIELLRPVLVPRITFINAVAYKSAYQQKGSKSFQLTLNTDNKLEG